MGDGESAITLNTSGAMKATSVGADAQNATLLFPPEAEPAPNYWALLLLVLPVLTALGNLLVILSVVAEKALQTSTNYLIVSLAVADFLVAILVMPWGIYVLMYGLWTLPFFFCDVYIAMDVVCSTASIFNLVAISIDRYQAVSTPMRYSQEQQSNDHRRVVRTILSIWLVASVLGLPIVLGWNSRSTGESKVTTECKLYNANFIIYSSVASFCVPCLIILLLYYRIMKAIVSHDKEKTYRRREARRRRKELERMQQQQQQPEKEAEEEQQKDEDANSSESRRHSRMRRWWRRFLRRCANDDEDEDEEVGTGGEDGDGLDGRVSPNPAVSQQKGIASLMSNLIRMSTNPLEKTDLVMAVHQQHHQDEERVPDEKPSPLSSSIENDEDMVKLEMTSKTNASTAATTDTNHGASSESHLQGCSCPSAGYVQISSPHQTTQCKEHPSSSSSTSPPPPTSPPLPQPQTCPNGRHPRPPSASVSTQISPRSGSVYANPQNGDGCGYTLSNRAVTFSRTGTNRASGSQWMRRSARKMLSTPAESTSSRPPRLLRRRQTTSSATAAASTSSAGSTLGTSIRVLRRAATWKIRNEERLHAKRERRERRATKTLGIVLGCFLFCWIPFFTCNLLSAVAIKASTTSLMPSMTLLLLTTWLGYVNSALNPLIYTVFNNEFRKAFKKLLSMNEEIIIRQQHQQQQRRKRRTRTKKTSRKPNNVSTKM